MERRRNNRSNWMAGSVGVSSHWTADTLRQFLPMPLPELDRILSGRTAARDLIGGLIEALSRRGIRFIAYYNHSCNGGNDPAWEEVCGYAAGCAGNLDRFAENICGIVGAISRRYGNGISAWWFDSCYSVDPRGPPRGLSRMPLS